LDNLAPDRYPTCLPSCSLAEARTALTHIPYKGRSQAVVDLLAGRIQIMFRWRAA
jgi:hypothetical protein